jgi:hypothetical protein
MRRYFHGVNTEDWDDFRGLWHEDAVVDVSGGLHFEGVDEIVSYYPRVLKSFPVHHDDPYAIHVAGDVVTVEIAFRGETLEGVAASWEAVDVFTLESGKIKKLSTWYDMGRVVELLRTPGAPEKRLARLVRLAAESSPFYRRRFAELGLDAARVTTDLSALPPTREADLAAAPSDFVAAPAREIRQLQTTRGGVPISLTRSDMEDAAWLLSRALELAGVTRDDVLLAREPIPALADAALRLRACLAAVPSPAAGERLNVTVVVEAAAFVETPETGVIAAPCTRRDGLHVFADAHIVEIVDGEVLVTPLGRRGTPLLRYATGHLADWADDPCSCGSELPGIVLRG